MTDLADATDPLLIELQQAICRGIVKANSTYSQWSGGYWVSDAGVENVVQVFVAEQCHEALKSHGYHLHLEAPVSYFFNRDGDKRRIDLLVADAEDEPVIGIEIKRGEGWYGADTEKMRDAMIGFRRRGDRRLKGFFWGIQVIWHGKKRIKDLAAAVERVKADFLDSLDDGRYQVDWVQAPLSPLDWPDDDGGSVRWEAAALVARVTRRD